MRPPFQIVPDTLSKDTVECLSALLEQAQQGKLIGLTFGAMFKGRHCITNTAGECSRNPLFTRGLIAALDDEVREMMGR